MLRRILRGVSTYAFAYFVVLELMLAAAVLYWPKFDIEKISDLIPFENMRELVEDIGDAGIAGYVLGQQFFKGCNTLGTAAAALFAASAVAGEVHRGTFEIWIARPYSRLRILTQRYVSGALATVVPVFLSTATIPWLATFIDEELEMVPLLWCAAQQSLVLLTIYGVTFLLSAMGSNPTRIALSVLFFTTLQFAIYFVDFVTHWSFFRLSDIQVYLAVYEDRRLDPGLTLPLLAVTAACPALEEPRGARLPEPPLGLAALVGRGTRGEPVDLAEGRPGLVLAPRGLQRLPAPERGLGAGPVVALEHRQRLERRGRIALREARLGQPQLGRAVGVLLVDGDGALEGRHRLTRPALVEQRAACPVGPLGHVRLAAGGFLEQRQGLAGTSLGEEQGAHLAAVVRAVDGLEATQLGAIAAGDQGPSPEPGHAPREEQGRDPDAEDPGAGEDPPDHGHVAQDP
jgi:hypothetical protein